MCTPVALMAGSLVISGVSSMMSYDESQRQADEARYNANQDYQLKQQALAQQKVQFTQQATDSMSDRAREALIERSRITTAAGEAGITGNTVDRLFNESKFNEGHDIASIQHNYADRVSQAELEAKGAAANFQSNLNQIESSRMSVGQLGLSLAGDYFSTATHYMDWQANTARVNRETTVRDPLRIK